MALAAQQEWEKEVKRQEAAEKKRIQDEAAAVLKAAQEAEMETRRLAKEAAMEEERRLANRMNNLANLSEEA